MKEKPKPPSPPRREAPKSDAREQEIGREMSPRMSELDLEERAAVKQLAEVEAALAAYEGRSSEMPEERVIAQRDAAKRRAELAEKVRVANERIAKKRRIARRRFVAVGVLCAAALVGAGFFVQEIVRESADQKASALALSKDEAPFVAEGFAPVASRALGIDADAKKGQCYVALAADAAGGAQVKVERDTGPVGPAASIAWCACADEHVKLESADGRHIAVELLSAPASRVGGPDLLAKMPATAALVLREANRSCVEEQLDAFVATAPVPPPHESLFRELTPLLEQGFVASSSTDATRAYGVVPTDADTCFVAFSRAATSTWVRVQGGKKLFESAAPMIAVCREGAEPIAIGREGPARIDVVSAQAARIGGALGLREAAARANVAIPSVGVVGDLSADAKHALVASGVAALDVLDPDHPASPPSLFAFSTRDAHGVSSLDFDAECAPALASHPLATMCVTPRPVTPNKELLPDGVAEAPKPRWLVPLGADKAGNAAALEVLALGRRLTLEGYVLTTLEAVRETPDGAAVKGRAGEKEVVAIALSSSHPWVATLSDGAPWTLGGDPRRVPLAAGETIELKATPKLTSHHEVMVWRK